MSAGWFVLIVVAVPVVLFVLGLARSARHERGDRVAAAYFNADVEDWGGGAS